MLETKEKQTRDMKCNLFRIGLARTALALLAVAPVSSARADYPSTVLSFHPPTYWRLNETTPVPADVATNLGSLGSIANGQYVGAASHGVAGPIGSETAANIPNSGHITIPFNPGLNPVGAFTVECWANGDASGGPHTLVQSMIQGQNPANANDRSGWNLREVGNDLQFVIGTASGAPFYYYYSAVGAITGAGWQHVVGVYDGSSFSVFVDGLQQTLTVSRQDGVTPAPGEVEAVRALTNFAGPTIIGERGYGGWNLNGDIADVAIYPSALSANTIRAHHDAATTNAAGYTSQILAANPAAYYPLDEAMFAPVLPTAVNLGTAGNSADGIYQPGTTTKVAGPPYSGLGAGSYACQFNGTTGYIDCGSPAELDTAGPISVMAWIKVSAFTVSWQAIVTKGDSAWRVHRNSSGSDSPYIGFGTTGLNNVDEAGSRNVNDGQWHHLVCVYDGSSTKSIYVDGTLDTAVPASGSISSDLYNVFIGENAQARGRYFNGSIAEVAVFTNSLTSAQVKQIYNAANVPPVITQQPQPPAGNIFEGQTVSMQVAAAGNLPLAYQWTKGGIKITGQTTTTLSLANLKTSDSGNYAVVVTNTIGSVTSAVVALTVQTSPPIIVTPPQSVTRYAGGTAVFSATVQGSVPITYQWLHGGGTIPGATGTTLTIPELQSADAGSYTFQASNAYGTSQAIVTLTFATATNVAAAVIDQGPLGYWRMDETSGTIAKDSWGNLDGLLNSGVTNNVPGPGPAAFPGFANGNLAYNFSGSASQVTMPAFGQFNSTMTIIAWINPNGSQVDYAGLVFTRGGGGGTCGLDFTQNQNLGYHWNDAGNTYNWRSGLVPTPGQWNFVALVVEPSQATEYLDTFDGSGLNSAVNTVNHGTANWTGVVFGADPTGGRSFKGSMDEVAVFSYALSADQIAAIRNAGASNNYAPSRLAVATQPQPQTVIVGGSATFSATVTGSQPISYQWQKNGVNIPGAVRSTLTVPATYYTDAGNYVLVAGNGLGNTNSAPARLTVMPSPSFANLTNELVLHLRFDGNYLDGSGHANDASAPNGSPSFLPGVLGQAVHIATSPGTNYLQVSNNAGDFAFDETVSFSVAFWVRYSGRFNDDPIIGNAINSTYQSGWVLTDEGGKIEYTLVNGANVIADPVGGSPIIGDGAWHHVVLVVDRSLQVSSAYVDGALVGSLSIVGLGSMDAGNLITIGQDPSGNYGSATFDLDDVGIWRRALTGYEAASAYSAALVSGQSFDVYGPVKLALRQVGSNLDLSWQAGTLLQSANAAGPYVPVPGASAPFYRTAPTNSAKFFRVRQ